MNIVNLSEDNFDEMIESKEMIVIDFWAKWCGPCQSFAKVIERIAPDYPEFLFGTIDIDREKGLAEEFHIQSIPSVMIMKNKVIVFAETGALADAGFRELLDQTKNLDAKELGKHVVEQEVGKDRSG